MKSTARNLILAALTLCAFMAAAPKVQSQTTLAVDSTKAWIGYMNRYTPPATSGVPTGGGTWGTAALTAFFTGSNTLTLTPNTNVYSATNTYWVNPDGSGAKNMDASMYVQDDTLAGQTLTFAGTCLTNSLVSPYTCSVFIKDFSGSYALNASVEVPVVGGQPFSITLGTAVGDHIQYGFETVGPDANPTNVASLGVAVMAVNNADPTLSSIPGLSLVAGQTATFSVTATGTAPFTYQWYQGNAANNTPLSNGGRISGVTSNVLTISNVVPTDSSAYSVFVLNANSQSAVATTSLSVIPLAQAKTNLLVDPSFESSMFSTTPTAGWVNFNGTAQANTNDFYFGSMIPVSVLDGTNCVQLYSDGPGSYNGVYQDRPVVPGDVYTGYVWLLTPSVDQIGGTGQAWVEAQYYNDNAGGAFIAYYKSGLLTTNSPTNTWIQEKLTNHLATDYVTLLGTAPYMVAPVGATRVRFQVNYLAGTGGSVYVDATDLKLVEVPPAAKISGSNIQLTFPTLYGPVYQVWYRTNLTTGTWQSLTTVNGDGTTKTVTDSLGTSRRFYVVNTQ